PRKPCASSATRSTPAARDKWRSRGSASTRAGRRPPPPRRPERGGSPSAFPPPGREDLRKPAEAPIADPPLLGSVEARSDRLLRRPQSVARHRPCAHGAADGEGHVAFARPVQRTG